MFFYNNQQYNLIHEEVYMQIPEKIIQSFIDALEDQIAVIDHKGFVKYANLAWDRFHLENVETLTTAAFVGDHYLDTLFRKGNVDASEGVKGVVNKSVEEYVLTYSCRHFSGERWYQLILRRCLLSDNHEGLVLINRSIKN